MILGLLLLLSLTSTVSAGAFVVNVTQTSHQAEEDHNITLEWTFTPRADGSLRDLNIFCELLTKVRSSVVFRLHEGVEVPESQDKQFKGRVQFDKDALKGGRLRLHVSRLRIEDSGLYRCEVFTSDGEDKANCRLRVSAAADEPRSQSPTESPRQKEMWLTIAGLAVALCVGLSAIRCFTKWPQKSKLSSSLDDEYFRNSSSGLTRPCVKEALARNPTCSNTPRVSGRTNCHTFYKVSG